MSKKYYLLTGFIFLVLSASAQTIRLSGKVINTKNEAISAATIAVQGNERAIAADVEGRFTLTLQAGQKYNITVSSAGYNTKVVEDVAVTADGDNTITVVLEDKTLTEVVVRSSARKESTSALINFQKNNTAVSSGLAADFIARTPDKNTGEVLKRVSGASIQDNKFVVIRGLGDRYNVAYINGAQLPSSEPDKKAFSFDVIPASVIDNIVINKTATPDLTGEFAGGLVQVTTKDVPARNFLTVGFSLGYNTVATGKNYVNNPRNNTDWLGFDNGTRRLPFGFPASRQLYNGLANQPDGLDQRLALTRLFRDDVYKEEDGTAGPIQTYNIAWGKRKVMKNGGTFGSIISVIYRKSLLTYGVNRNLADDKAEPVQSYFDAQNKYNVNIGAMANFTYIKGKHKISFKNLFNRYFEDNYYRRVGPNYDRGGDVMLLSSVLNQRSFYTGIFEGSHQLNWKSVKVNWNAGYSLNDKSQPDLRTMAYFRGGVGSTNPFEWDQDDTRRFFSNLQDHGVSGNLAVTFPFELFKQQQSLKIGGSGMLRFRDFKSRIFRYVEASGSFDNDLRFLPFDEIFNKNNISRQGFVMEEFTNNEDKYFALSALNAGYVMFDNKFSDNVRLIWGARVEYFEQFLHTKDRSAKRIIINPEKWSILPSVNLSINLNTRNIIRVSGSQTVSRPEFREIAPFQFFDYETTFGVRGNPDLKITNIYNIDARYEIYPSAGEAITIGGFMKRFTNPIEFRLDPGSVLTRRNYFYQNARDANTYGVELEVRKNLRFLGGNTDLLSNFSIFANFTYIFSEVKFDDEALGKVVSADRPVQGQSPYLINGGLQYTSKTAGWNATLLYNRVGNRLALVGYQSFGFPDVYENPRDVLDIQVSKRVFKKKGEIKLAVSDILNQYVLYYENVDNNRIYDSKVDRIWSRYKPGATFTLGFTYDFDL